MFERRRLKCLIVLMLGIFISGIVFLCYLCPERMCATTNDSKMISEVPEDASFRNRVFLDAVPREDLHRDYHFDVDGDRDVLVFLHIQKTGGSTFERHLVRNTDVSRPCVCYKHRKRCDCENSSKHIWLFSRYSTGWACGLHADWTELHDCVPKTLDEREEGSRLRRYLYFTILRDPIQRYISEWKHVQRGSTWLSAKLMCNGRQATLDEVPFCFQGADWTGVTLKEFLYCPHNLAHNRQTRMLSNLSLIGCYNRTLMPNQRQRDQLMLESAKDNLRNMAFFGLTEYQAETRYLFERTFHLRFTKDFVQYKETHASKTELTDDERDRLTKMNRQDVALYAFAKELFLARLQFARGKDKRRSSADADGEVSSVIPTSSPPPGVHYEEGEENYDGEGEEVDDEELEEAKHRERVARTEKSRRRKEYSP